MTLPLTADTLRAAYDYLNTTPPFTRWNLPEGVDVHFRVVRDPKSYADYHWSGTKHVICVSARLIGFTSSLMSTMAHEMIHLHEENANACGRGEHSAAFQKWAAQVCRSHGFDPKLF